MTALSRLCLVAALLLAPGASVYAADKPKEIRLDWATYNPVSMVLKEQGLLEKEFAKDGIAIRWVQTLGSNKALEFLSAGAVREALRFPLCQHFNNCLKSSQIIGQVTLVDRQKQEPVSRGGELPRATQKNEIIVVG